MSAGDRLPDAARDHRAAGRRDAAAALYRQRRAKESKDSEALLLLGVVASPQDRRAEALVRFVVTRRTTDRP